MNASTTARTGAETGSVGVSGGTVTAGTTTVDTDTRDVARVCSGEGGGDNDEADISGGVDRNRTGGAWTPDHDEPLPEGGSVGGGGGKGHGGRGGDGEGEGEGEGKREREGEVEGEGNGEGAGAGAGTGARPEPTAKKRARVVGESGRGAGRRHRVTFAVGRDDVHVFDKRDAPSVNIHEIEQAVIEENQETLHTLQEPIIENALSIEEAVEVKQTFNFSGLEGTVTATFDTETMTVSQLKEALNARGLSAVGRRHELQKRLEDDLTKGTDTKATVTTNKGHPPKPTKKKGRLKKDHSSELPSWLQWQS
ncbi:hypothetical protein Pelo_14541 [Pelomyxa schiedti]|nr:hypothetical protein Pelo_14541 [Pelomyxa schiedti]